MKQIKGTVRSSLFEPKRGKPMSFLIRKEQVILTYDNENGFIRGTVKRIQSHDNGKTYGGVCDGQKVVRVGYANGFRTKKGETAGKWKIVA